MTPTDTRSDKTGRNRGPADTRERKQDDVNDAQPYSNRGSEDESTEPRGYEETSEGDRGESSGRNLDQLEQAKTRPADRKL